MHQLFSLTGMCRFQQLMTGSALTKLASPCCGALCQCTLEQHERCSAASTSQQREVQATQDGQWRFWRAEPDFASWVALQAQE
mmetsp:Transcript_15343/g.27888  ORF Transcript_15343/g.27888 Transcript_15343/m.27888 type:complete len:83 (-) Transcript_15343:67-315(-)